MEIFIIFVCMMVLGIYFTAAQQDDISFLVLAALLLCVLYFVTSCPKRQRYEYFSENQESASTSNQLDPTLLDQVKDTYTHVYKVFGDNIDYVIKSLSSDAEEIETVEVTEEDFKGDKNADEAARKFKYVNACLFYIEKYDPDLYQKIIS